MKNSAFWNKNLKTIIFNSCLIIFGILLCAMPQKFLGVLEVVVASFLILFGLINLFGYCFSPKFLKDPFMLFESVVLIVAGFLIDIVSNMFILVLGLIILIFGIKRIISAVGLQKLGKSDWWIDLIFGIVVSVLGLLIAILCNTKIVQSAIIILLGASLILSGIISLVIAFALHRQEKSDAVAENQTIEIDGEVK